MERHNLDLTQMLGFPLPNIAAGTSLTVTFQVTVVAPSTRGAVLNTASATATFLLNPLQPPVTTTNSSNTTVVTIRYLLLSEVTATKTVDVATGAVRDVLTYTVLHFKRRNYPCYRCVLPRCHTRRNDVC